MNARFDPVTAVGLRLGTALKKSLGPVAIWAVALLGFAAMAAAASATSTFPGDAWVTRRIQDMRGEPQGAFLDAASLLVEWPYWSVVVVIAVGAALLRAGAPAVPVILLALPSRFLVSHVLKQLVERPRPSPDVVEVERLLSTYSFPSGHAFNAVIIYGLIFYLVSRYVPLRMLRLPIQVFSCFVIVGTGVERIYYGYHWPSDVVGGYYLGGLVLAALIGLGELLRRERRARRG